MNPEPNGQNEGLWILLIAATVAAVTVVAEVVPFDSLRPF
jgi:hypothetical protein